MWWGISIVIIGLLLGAFYKTGQTFNIKNQIIAGKIVQLLESSQIIDTTANIQVMQERLQLVLTLLMDISKVGDDSLLKKGINSGLDQYKERYPVNALTPTQKMVIEAPEKLGSPDFLVSKLGDCFQRYCNKKKGEIYSLKTDTAKAKRRDEMQAELGKCHEILMRVDRLDSFSIFESYTTI